MDVEIKTGMVMDVENNRLLVKLEPAGKGGRCGEFCECTANVEKIKGPRVWVEYDGLERFQPKDKVEIEVRMPSVFVAFALFFALPTVGLLAGAAGGMVLTDKLEILAHQLVMTASMALAGCVVAMAPALLIDRMYRKNHQAFLLLGKKICRKQKLALGALK